jgi:hypothetical protein
MVGMSRYASNVTNVVTNGKQSPFAWRLGNAARHAASNLAV